MRQDNTILISNDDGIHAPGISALVEYVKHLGRVIVVAPDKERSSTSSAITLKSPVTIHDNYTQSGVEYFSISGNPADCVKLGISELIKTKPNLVLTGINNGSNASINTLYSGTVAAAIQGYCADIPSVAFSLINANHLEPKFEHTESFVSEIAKWVLNTFKDKVCLNVNMPFYSNQLPIKGIKYCKQAEANWEESYRREGKAYYLEGEFLVNRGNPDYAQTDQWALENNYISIVPIKTDFTDYNRLKIIKS